MQVHCNKVPNKKKSELRKKPSDFSFAVYDSIAMINSEHWHSIVNFGSEYLQLDYLSVMEKAPPPNMRFHYAIIYDALQPVAISYFQVVDFSSESFGNMLEQESEEFKCFITNYIKKHITNHLLWGADKINMRLLICGNAFVSGEHGFTTVLGLDKTSAFDALADVIYRIARAEKLRGKIAAVLVKDFYTDSIKYSKELEEYKYHDFLVEPSMIVDIQWKTFEEYLNAMSKKYRHRAKGIVKKGLEVVRKEFTAEDIKATYKEIEKLYNNVHLKAKFRMASLGDNYFVELNNTLKEKFRFTGYYFNNKLIGFRTLFILKHDVEAHFIGLDYEVNKELELYQNILYDYVKDGIENNAKRLFLGRTASEIKSTVGAKAYELKCYIRHRNPLSNRIIKPFIDYLKPSEWIPRSPFKEEKEI